MWFYMWAELGNIKMTGYFISFSGTLYPFQSHGGKTGYLVSIILNDSANNAEGRHVKHFQSM